MTVAQLADTVTSTAVMRATGLSYRTLDYWCRTGLLEQAVPARGSGSQRRFARREIDVIRVLRHHIREHGPHGTFELIPGVTLDLDVLASAP